MLTCGFLVLYLNLGQTARMFLAFLFRLVSWDFPPDLLESSTNFCGDPWFSVLIRFGCCSLKNTNLRIIISNWCSFMQRLHKTQTPKNCLNSAHLCSSTDVWKISWDARFETTARLGLHSFNMNTPVSYILRLLASFCLERNLII